MAPTPPDGPGGLPTVVCIEVGDGELRDRALRLVESTVLDEVRPADRPVRVFALVDVAGPDSESLQAVALVEPLATPGLARLTCLAAADGAPEEACHRLLDEVVLAVCGVGGGRLVGRQENLVDGAGPAQHQWSPLDEWLASGGEVFG